MHNAHNVRTQNVCTKARKKRILRHVSPFSARATPPAPLSARRPPCKRQHQNGRRLRQWCWGAESRHFRRVLRAGTRRACVGRVHLDWRFWPAPALQGEWAWVGGSVSLPLCLCMACRHQARGSVQTATRGVGGENGDAMARCLSGCGVGERVMGSECRQTGRVRVEKKKANASFSPIASQRNP
jgi:hypothetical protein